METVKPIISSLITEKCYVNYFEEFNLFDGGCFKTLISKALGYGIVAGSMMVKVPQIQKIVSARSGEGISMMSTLMELFAYVTMLAYGFAKGFPFSTYGDSLFVMLQTVMIGFLYLMYGGQQTSAYLFLITSAATTLLLTSGITPISVLTSMQALNLPVVIVAKSVQIGANYRAGSTGQLSLLTVALLFLGSLARIFTSVQETGDTIIIISFVVGSLMNGLILAQIFYYWDKKPAKKQD